MDKASLREQNGGSKVHVGFVGFGNQAIHHARYLVEHLSEKITLVAVCDILDSDLQLVRSNIEKLGLRDVSIYTIDSSHEFDLRDIRSVSKLLESHPEISAIIISTPSAKHYYQAKFCLENQRHVLVDKPLALSYEHGKQLVQLADNSRGPYLVVSSQRRYEDIYQYAKKSWHLAN